MLDQVRMEQQQKRVVEEAGTASRPSIAVIILTFNEEKNISDCLDSIGDWAEEIFVVDSYSTDRTIDLLLERADPRLCIVQHAFENYSKQWNWALKTLPIRAQWTLKLDADERLTPAFIQEVNERLTVAPRSLEGLWFRRRFVFMGTKLGTVGTLRYDLRLWRTGKGHFDNSGVNEHAHVAGDTHRLRTMVDHVDNKTITDWLDKHNRYSSMMAIGYTLGTSKNDIKASLIGNTVERTKFFERIYLQMPFRPLIIFFQMYVMRLGFLHGRVGFHYCMLRSFFFYLIDLKMLESRITGRPPEVVFPPRGQPDPRLPVMPGT